MSEELPRETLQIPPGIARALSRFDGQRPAFACLKRGRETVYKPVERLTVADCEQLVEHHLRAATVAIKRFHRTGSRVSAGTAAESLWRARVFRETYCRITGQKETEALFTIASEADATPAGGEI